jgi:hypothetical protein
MNNQESQGTTTQADEGLGEMRCSVASRFSLRCFFGIHSWTKWMEVKRQYHSSTYRHLVHQERNCVCCNKLEGRQEYY